MASQNKKRVEPSDPNPTVKRAEAEKSSGHSESNLFAGFGGSQGGLQARGSASTSANEVSQNGPGPKKLDKAPIEASVVREWLSVLPDKKDSNGPASNSNVSTNPFAALAGKGVDTSKRCGSEGAAPGPSSNLFSKDVTNSTGRFGGSNLFSNDTARSTKVLGGSSDVSKPSGLFSNGGSSDSESSNLTKIFGIPQVDSSKSEKPKSSPLDTIPESSPFGSNHTTTPSGFYSHLPLSQDIDHIVNKSSAASVLSGSNLPASQNYNPFGTGVGTSSLFGSKLPAHETKSFFGSATSGGPFSSASGQSFFGLFGSQISAAASKCSGSAHSQFRPTTLLNADHEQGVHQSITMMTDYHDFSFEELRVADYELGRGRPKPSLQYPPFSKAYSKHTLEIPGSQQSKRPRGLFSTTRFSSALRADCAGYDWLLLRIAKYKDGSTYRAIFGDGVERKLNENKRKTQEDLSNAGKAAGLAPPRSIQIAQVRLARQAFYLGRTT